MVAKYDNIEKRKNGARGRKSKAIKEILKVRLALLTEKKRFISLTRAII